MFGRFRFPGRNSVGVSMQYRQCYSSQDALIHCTPEVEFDYRVVEL